MAAIFDLDGTLLDTLDDLTAAVNAALQAAGLEETERDQVRQMIGDGNRQLCSRALGQAFSRLSPLEQRILISNDALGSRACSFPVLHAEGEGVLKWESCDCPVSMLEAFFETFTAYYAAHALEQTRPYAGLPDVLSALRRQGQKLAVLTNKNETIAKQLIHHFYPGIFDPVYGMTSGRAPKPDSETALQICREWDTAPAAVCLVGDSEQDMQTALNSGIVALGVDWGYRSKTALRQAGAQAIAATAADLYFDLSGRHDDKDWH